jgi:hypothetical protein
MEEKICTKCSKKKELNLFVINNKLKSGFTSRCKECTSKYKKEYAIKNKNKIIEKKKEYYLKNNDLIKEKRIIYLKNNKNKIAKTTKIYYENNKEKIIKYQKKYKLENKIKRSFNEKNRLNVDPLYKLKTLSRKIIGKSLKNNGFKKMSRTHEILGCSYEEFKLYLESKFESWMNWENYGNPKDGILELNKTWDIDHIIPLASAKTEEDVMELNNFNNLQPLCSYTNRFIKKDFY